MAASRARPIIRVEADAGPRAAFLRSFPGGFRDPAYLADERQPRLDAHAAWERELSADALGALLRERDHRDVATEALRLATLPPRPMLSSAEARALRAALGERRPRWLFSHGLCRALGDRAHDAAPFDAWRDDLAAVLGRAPSWPLVTAFPALAHPARHVLVRPATMRRVAPIGLDVRAPPKGTVYAAILRLARRAKWELADLRPRDVLDVEAYWRLTAQSSSASSATASAAAIASHAPALPTSPPTAPSATNASAAARRGRSGRIAKAARKSSVPTR